MSGGVTAAFGRWLGVFGNVWTRLLDLGDAGTRGG